MEEPPKKFYRLAPGREVRLRYAYFVTCTKVVKNADGEIAELHCTYDPATRGGDSPDGRKVKSTLHWVSTQHAVDAEVLLYDHLFTKENPEEVDQATAGSLARPTALPWLAAQTREGKDFTANLNPNSLEVLTGCKVEPSLKDAKPLQRFQFERLGYFCVDPDSACGKLIFNRTVTLKDEWAKIQSASGGLPV